MIPTLCHVTKRGLSTDLLTILSSCPRSYWMAPYFIGKKGEVTFIPLGNKKIAFKPKNTKIFYKFTGGK